MEEEIEYDEGTVSRPGFTIVYKSFLRNWIRIIGPGSTMLYLQLLSYCYGKKSVRKYREVLIKYGLIEKMYKRKSADGSYQTNVYEIVRSEDLPYPGAES